MGQNESGSRRDRRWRADLFEQSRNLAPMAGVVFEHHAGQISQRDRTSSIEQSAPFELAVRGALEKADGFRPRQFEIPESGGAVLRPIVPFGGDFRAIKVLQVRILFVKNPMDADQVAFAFEVPEMAGLFEEGKIAVGGGFGMILGRDFGGGFAKYIRHGLKLMENIGRERHMEPW